MLSQLTCHTAVQLTPSERLCEPWRTLCTGWERVFRLEPWNKLVNTLTRPASVGTLGNNSFM
jgi:hypothetical protein